MSNCIWPIAGNGREWGSLRCAHGPAWARTPFGPSIVTTFAKMSRSSIVSVRTWLWHAAVVSRPVTVTSGRSMMITVSQRMRARSKAARWSTVAFERNRSVMS